MPSLDQRLGLVVARQCGIAQSFGHVAVHHAFAGNKTQLASECFLEQRVHRLRIDRAIDARRGRAVADQRVAEHARDRAGVCLVGEGFLGGIDVVVDPLQQLLARRSDHLGLHIVHMGVDEAGRENAA